MSNKKECLIVSELLPLYIEKQTGQHSNEYIEAHIKNCDECNLKMKYMSEVFDECIKHEEINKEKSIFDKIKKRLIVGYMIILAIIWIFIFICFI